MRRLLGEVDQAARNVFLFPDNRTGAAHGENPGGFKPGRAGSDYQNPPVFKPFLVCGMERRFPARKWVLYTEDGLLGDGFTAALVAAETPADGFFGSYLINKIGICQHSPSDCGKIGRPIPQEFFGQLR